MKHPDLFTPTAAPVDRRLIVPGLGVTVADLVAVFIDHRPGDMPACGRCRHRYTTAAPLCPSRPLAGQLLKRRQHEAPDAVDDVAKDLPAHDPRVLPLADPPVSADPGGLFAVDP